ncbi:ECF transporter S component [Corynebacterium uropygiale]|uniref:ECF transporter S component n=1 Tax=Corynebacterium uropygiale TaxID=1775911 RepID=A0A9X1QNF7_9CORY|nr:ECF transporter S component [Corynebacterium uropygiale]MCF4005851.1 ECF transporter S component [Corynebacterium uropygiale]
MSHAEQPSSASDAPTAPKARAPKGAPRSSSRSRLADSVLGTRNLMTVAAIAVVGAIIVVPMTWLSMSFTLGTGNLLFLVALMGIWVIPYALPISVVPRPGASVVAGFIIGVITMITTPVGPSGILGSVLGALFVEIGYLIFLYRRMNERVLFLGCAVFGLLNGLLYIFGMFTGVSGTTKLLACIISIASSLVGGVIVMFITRALHRAGVGIPPRR